MRAVYLGAKVAFAEKSIIKIFPGNDGSPPYRDLMHALVAEGWRSARESERETGRGAIHVFPELGEHALRTSGV